MNSSGAKTLEAIIKQEEEIQVAIESLLETPVGDDVEAVSPVIEQQLDPESYENTSYSIEAADYDSASYDTGKNYYELVMGGDDDKPIGASMTAVYSEYYHELLQDVQQIAANTRAGDESRHTYVEPHVDFATREKKDSVKLVSVAVWQAMYDGKLRFN